jgi:uncharacterized protein YkwD
MLGAHNDARIEAGRRPLSWNDDAAAVAQAFADTCPSEHSSRDGRKGMGENLAWGSSIDAEGAAGLWVDESRFYDMEDNSCEQGKVCGHYTQVIWGSTTGVGCGTAECGSISALGGRSGSIFVCNYTPPGNIIGNAP